VIVQRKLEDLIREKVPLGRLSPQGFYSLKCPVCSDYKERGGFKFDAGTVGYNCFNCGTHAKHEEGEGRISRSMRRVLNAFGIDDSEISAVVNTGFFFKPKEKAVVSLSDLKKVNTATPQVKLPPKALPLGGTTEFLEYQQKLVDYLVKRKVDLDRYHFFFSLEERFLNRVIIPFYRNGNLIFWQARGVEEGMTPRYDSAPVSRDAVLFNFDQLYTGSPLPLFVVEGAFDAMPFDGVAILGSKLNDAKIELLSKARRRLIFVIDKDKNGKSLAEHALQLGWEITFTPDGANDINRSVQRFGFSWTAYQLMQNIRHGSEAQLAISMRCK
jgi:hypothetical protein